MPGHIHRIKLVPVADTQEVVASAVSRKNARAASDALRGIDWASTVEGHDFWNDVDDRLMQIAVNGKLR